MTGQMNAELQRCFAFDGAKKTEILTYDRNIAKPQRVSLFDLPIKL